MPPTEIAPQCDNPPEVPPGFKVIRPEGPFGAVAGPFYFRAAGEGRFRYGFLPRPEHTNPVGMVHGGALYTFADQIMGRMLYSLDRRMNVTVSLTVEYLAATKPGEWVDGEVEVVRMTRSLAFLRCLLRVRDEPICAVGGVFKFLRTEWQGRP
ncbi:MAG: PaaI family thioesterase [Alphaproteobacteria bacterium]|nr:PaaI family thioesterase [Alphaproteobacteria bacterium]